MANALNYMDGCTWSCTAGGYTYISILMGNKYMTTYNKIANNIYTSVQNSQTKHLKQWKIDQCLH